VPTVVSSCDGGDSMTIDEFLRRATSQPVANERRVVRVWGTKLRQLFAQRKARTVAEIFAHPDQQKEQRTFRRGHILGPGLPDDAIESWQQRRPSHPLPPDLTKLLNRVNGIHLWADLDSQRAYFGILPLEEWEDISRSPLAPLFADQPSGQLAMSYHQNGDYYLVLDTTQHTYLWYDTQDFGGKPRLVAENVEGLLSWWWEQAAELAPETTNP
jgi:hypothetical protein